MANSIEEQVEGYYKNLLKSLGVRYYAKTEEINSKITEALKNSVSYSLLFRSAQTAFR